MRHHLYLGMLISSLLIGSTPGLGQTSISLKHQAKNVDFSTASATKPMRVGTDLPATCAIGEQFFRIDPALDNNVYGCTATDVWSLLSGGDPGAGLGIVVTTGVVAVDDAILPLYTQSPAAPAGACTAGRDFHINTALQLLYYCANANTWRQAPRILSGAASPAAGISRFAASTWGRGEFCWKLPAGWRKAISLTLNLPCRGLLKLSS